jgi:hypothetical protein
MCRNKHVKLKNWQKLNTFWWCGLFLWLTYLLAYKKIFLIIIFERNYWNNLANQMVCNSLIKMIIEMAFTLPVRKTTLNMLNQLVQNDRGSFWPCPNLVFLQKKSVWKTKNSNSVGNAMLKSEGHQWSQAMACCCEDDITNYKCVWAYI